MVVDDDGCGVMGTVRYDAGADIQELDQDAHGFGGGGGFGGFSPDIFNVRGGATCVGGLLFIGRRARARVCIPVSY